MMSFYIHTTLTLMAVTTMLQVLLPGRCLTAKELSSALRLHRSLRAGLGSRQKEVDMPVEEELGAVEVILTVLELLALLNASSLVWSSERVTGSAREVLEELRSLSAVSLSDVLRVQQVDSSLYAVP